jgi:hypothetical protein
MAAKKTSTKKETTKKETKTKSKSKAKSKKVKLTFNPIMSAANKFTILLRKQEMQRVRGEDIPVNVPLIEGLPMKLVIEKGEVIEVTEEQLEQLAPWVETKEEYEKRQEFIDNMSAQHPENLTWDMIVAEGGNWATLADSQRIVYNDKLLRV